MPRRRIAGLRGILTGASSGIGRALAQQLAAEGAQLVLVARRADRLREIIDGLPADRRANLWSVVGDITDPQVRADAIQAALDAFGGLDFLVNNAGIGAQGRFVDADPDRARQIFDVNFFALVEMTRAAIPHLRAGRDPLLVNIGSILGHRGIPYSSEYCASKFAVRGFSEALRAELARLKIEVLLVSPGTTESEFFDKLIEAGEKPPWPEQPPVPASEVAQRIISAMERRRHEIIPNPRGRLMVWLNRLAPRLVDAWMARYG
jgi:short-subunit dehydrogenase